MRLDSLLRRSALILTTTLMGVGIALAAPAWKQLTAPQQALIEPALKSQGAFDTLPEPRRNALVKGADRWLAMTPEQRTAATRQFQQWQQLNTVEKVAVLERREQFRKLSSEQRKTLLDARKHYLDLPLQQQINLKEQFNLIQSPFEGLPTHPFAPATPTAPGSSSVFGLPLGSTPFGLPLNSIGTTVVAPVLAPLTPP
ncbi:MAG: DUF3106 domain-containing protein [Stagnimonas sp.]|nr:DUF3106 domain-containing protein [Stagnimonas sp.]